GYNITLVILTVNFLFGFISLKRRFWVSIFLIFCFVFMVGASASVVRAGIMGGISLCAIYFGREYYVLRALFFSAFLMTIFNPKILAYDVGFHLSFLSSLGLILMGDLFKNKLLFLPEKFLIRETCSMTLASQVFTLPIVMMNFGRVSLVSILANLFVLPFIPLAMLFGMASVFFGSFFGFFGFLFLEIIVMFVNFFASFPFAAIDIPDLPDFVFIFYYIFICFAFRAQLRSLAN
ncbi:MAG: ComEC/Rec2 family competence protein, partial [Candidatus Pelagibacter sp.]|nr:ComEC/Rec2 family competence protein [Candidatus Pelagibacter sp.]